MNSNFKMSMRLIGLVKQMLPIMILAITLGVLGFLAAIMIPVLGAYGIGIFIDPTHFSFITLQQVIILIVVCSLLRGLLRYGEQASNHYIAFKVLAIIRDIVFKKLRKLAPAKLEGRDSGELVSMITTDVELLEVFYAHTISPVAIAIITNLLVVLALFVINPVFGLIGLCSYLIIGVAVPFYITRIGADIGTKYRDDAADMSDTVLDGLYGLDEIKQYNYDQNYLEMIKSKTENLVSHQAIMRKVEGKQQAITNTLILATGLIAIAYVYVATSNGLISSSSGMLGFVLLVSSFGPVVALSNLANNLLITFGSAKRLLGLLDEEVITTDVTDGIDLQPGDIQLENVNFKYNNNQVLRNLSMVIENNKIIGIKGESGSGKSTVLKLLMRFYQTDMGTIKYNTHDINGINTTSLRSNISFVQQETFLLNDTIRENLKLAKLDATSRQMIDSLKLAVIDQFVISLPAGLDTIIGENGSNLSGGERQRLGIARAILSDSQYIILDEPTANLDTLGESIILDSLRQIKNKTIIIVSHRSSTLGICDQIIDIEELNG
ncbi:MAG: amino acid ABC transporter ATP-binding/permease protein [Coprobacillaceae bacterium]